MRLIDADKLMADDTFCEGIECDMCSLSYIDDVYHCRACGVTKWIINQPTACDIDAITTELKALIKTVDDMGCPTLQFRQALAIIYSHTKGDRE